MGRIKRGSDDASIGLHGDGSSGGDGGGMHLARRGRSREPKVGPSNGGSGKTSWRAGLGSRRRESTEARFELLDAGLELADRVVCSVKLRLESGDLHALAPSGLLGGDAVLDLAAALPKREKKSVRSELYRGYKRHVVTIEVKGRRYAHVGVSHQPRDVLLISRELVRLHIKQNTVTVGELEKDVIAVIVLEIGLPGPTDLAHGRHWRERRGSGACGVALQLRRKL